MNRVHCDLAIPLKGGRTYVRGADIYSAVIGLVARKSPQALGRCRFTFRRLPRRMLSASFAESGAVSQAPEQSVAAFAIDGAPEVSGWIYERAEPITAFVPFDEEGLIADARLEATTISIAGRADGSAIDLAVAMTKALHNRLRPIAMGKWILTRLDLIRPFGTDDNVDMSVSLKQELGPKLTRCDVRSGERSLGSIFFSAGQP
jgi:hypothetical protein